MGNYISCTNLSLIKGSRRISVVFPTGEIRKFKEPKRAAELMVEAPNYFLVNTKSLQVGHRYCPLSADDDLESANIYVMLPMNRRRSVVSSEDMFGRASRGDHNRVMPESEVELSENANDRGAAEVLSRLSLEGDEVLSMPQYVYPRSSTSRTKKPLLETIEEEPATCSR